MYINVYVYITCFPCVCIYHISHITLYHVYKSRTLQQFLLPDSEEEKVIARVSRGSPIALVFAFAFVFAIAIAIAIAFNTMWNQLL